jgi:hypothetical protein
VGFAESAALAERRFVEIPGFDAQAGGDVVADEDQLGALLGGEYPPLPGLGHEPFGLLPERYFSCKHSGGHSPHHHSSRRSRNT